jgi:iron-sulfur cluster assembly protein
MNMQVQSVPLQKNRSNQRANRLFTIRNKTFWTMQMEGGIYISDQAKNRVQTLLQQDGRGDDYFVRVSVVSGGCSGLSYKMDFDNQQKPTDQVFTDKGMKIVTDFKSVLYLFNTMLDYSDGLHGKGFHFINPNASRTCACGESFSV